MQVAPRRLSFASQLAVFWALVAVMCAVLIGLVWFMAQANGGRQIDLARAQSLAGCEAVASRYDVSVDATADAPPNIDLMHAILDVVLAQMQGVEGGFWIASANARGTFTAYAFPTYRGSGIKRDVPEAETPLILRTLRQVASTHAATTEFVVSDEDAVIVAACEVPHRPALLAWTLTRTHPPLGPYGRPLVTGLAVLLAVIVAIAIALGIVLRRWRANLAHIGESLARNAGTLQPIAPTGEPDLDKIVAAFNSHLTRTTALQQEAGELNARLAHAERFAMLGQLAAQVAHEIRNPIGAMRLKAENALAGEPERRERALSAILEQIERVESQLSGLLVLTQPIRIDAHDVPLAAWLAERIEVNRDAAQRAGVTLEVGAAPQGPARFDAQQLARSLDNLLLNAIRHAPHGGRVTLSATRSAESLKIEVADNGPGVPAAERERIFEPFVTGHALGSGLGLAVVREIAAAHGGRAYCAASGDENEPGARFIIEIP
ncbi:integral membrane sensor signal transduction histidine kinase [Caballeronia arationis]|jgi:signal transduction histidine kinase|uniref:histidine kinase n=1 Tax=Caballeronia arationis TaxID=1777142 RepID=A0A7Z7I2X0_9BURK|nr:HAMP domain-containing sensor histidine kinase [Caballeronia arationis]SAL05050.1 integral membrane sensor signal transduction histidine kinase [Caballeronia arationis]SOE55061.1 histidine kinase [Caballeronia arationis]